MKNFIAMIAAGAMVLGLTACSGEGSPLSASSAKKALKKEAVFAKDSQVKTFETGFQEVSESHLNSLAQLKAAGMVEYTTEKAIEKVTRREWGGFYVGYVTRTEDVVHVFADVKLTAKGEKYVIAEPTVMREDLVKDFKANKDYQETEPEYMSATDNAFGVAAEVVEEAEPMDDSDYVAEETVVEETVEEPAQKPAVDPNAAYHALQARVATESHNVLLGRFEIDKVKEVLCTEDMFKAGQGSCTVLYKFVDKTPFGYVLGAPAEGLLQSSTVKFRHYQDLGWTVTE